MMLTTQLVTQRLETKTIYNLIYIYIIELICHSLRLKQIDSLLIANDYYLLSYFFYIHVSQLNTLWQHLASGLHSKKQKIWYIDKVVLIMCYVSIHLLILYLLPLTSSISRFDIRCVQFRRHPKSSITATWYPLVLCRFKAHLTWIAGPFAFFF